MTATLPTSPRRAYGMVLAAYVLWGFLPLYWPYLRPAGLIEILAHRAVWSLVAAVGAVLLLRRRRELVGLFTTRRTRILLTVSAVALLVNWLVFLGAADRGEGVDISLGYFINPLMTVAIGRIVLREVVRPWQWVAFGGACVGVVVLTVDAAMFPLTGFGLALSWAAYGLAKKLAGVGAVESLAFETLLIAPWGALYLATLSVQGDGQFTSGGPFHALLLVGGGIVTIVPLVLFSAGAPHVSMVSLGPIQYVGPAIQFLLGVFLLHNEMPSGRWLGFAVIGGALAVFVIDGRRAAKHRTGVEVPALTLVKGAGRLAPRARSDPGLGIVPTGVGTRRLRQVLSHAPTSVTVVCTLDGQDPVGHTIGSFVSVSLDPPLVGYFAMRSSATLGAVRRSGMFSVNVLAEHQAELGQLFAHRGERFDGVRWRPGAGGCPHLDGALAVLDCDVHQVLTVGDHEMVIGRVTAATAQTPGGNPLVFAGGRFRALSRITPGRVSRLAAISSTWGRAG